MYDTARVFEKEFFYFNKQAIVLTNVDEAGKGFGAKGKRLKLAALQDESGCSESPNYSCFSG